jgi:hypothetical protein
MKTNKLTTVRINRIREQGYTCHSENQISDLAFGNRFAYRACVSILIPGVVLANIPLLSVMLVVAFFGVVLPNHPFDYFYNHVLSKRMHKPVLPARSKQLKFACGMATVMIGATISLIYTGNLLAAYILGGVLISVATLVSTIDFCIPSIIFNTIFKINTANQMAEQK